MPLVKVPVNPRNNFRSLCKNGENDVCDHVISCFNLLSIKMLFIVGQIMYKIVKLISDLIHPWFL